MDLSQYRRFTEELLNRLSGDDRVVGLVALGSMAERDYSPDAFSDHDFFVVARTGTQEAMRRELVWLPRFEEVVLSFRETEHGVKVLYGDGHLLEFAVFDPTELRLAKVNRYRVLLDRGGIADALAGLASESARAATAAVADDGWLCGQLLTQLQVGGGRAARGEELSARMVLGHALRSLLVLIEKHVEAAAPELLDDLDPHRRFERAYPLLGARLRSAMREDALGLARAMAELADRELSDRVPDFPKRALQVVRRRLG